MIGIGFFEIVIIGVVCFIAVGPKQIPMLMRKMAAFYRQFITLRDELRFQILSADEDVKKNINDMRLDNPMLVDKEKEKLVVTEPKEPPHG